MSGENSITVTGNLTADPELRFTPVSREFGKTEGTPVANFTIASTPRTFDPVSKEWKDGETLFLRASVWREAAEYAAETLTKGTRVIAQGRLKPRSYETKTGEKRTAIELEIDEIAVSLKFGPIVHHPQRATNQDVEEPAEESAGEPAGVHPVDLLPISPRAYADDDAWFGKIANPDGRGAPTPPEGQEMPVEEPVFKGLSLPPGTLTWKGHAAGPTTPGTTPGIVD